MSAANRKGKETKQKVNFKEAEIFAISKMKEIRDVEAPNSVKAQKERRLGKSCLVKLAGRSSRSDENKPSLSYLNREVTKLRTAIRLHGFIRHDFNDKISELSKNYPIAEKELLSLVDIEHKEAKKAIADTVAKLTNRYNRTKDGAKKSELKQAVAKLKKVSFEPVIFETLVRTATQKEDLATAAEERIERYHSTQRPVDYHKTYELMARLLASEHNWMALAFGLVLASGRRSTEIACYIDGKFKPTRNNREAEFTSIVKTKEAKTYRIPLLVDFKTFSEALDRLRTNPRIAELMSRIEGEDNYDKRHKEINSSIQQQLNEFVKKTMNSDEWVFKDGRAMYARITYAEYCATEKKAGRLPMTDDLFFKKKLGHTDPATQQNYKQFTLINAESLHHREVKRTKADAETAAKESRDRLAELSALFESDAVQNRRAFAKYAGWVVEQIKADPTIKISSSWIKAELGGNKGIIAEFVRLVKDAGLQTAF